MSDPPVTTRTSLNNELEMTRRYLQIEQLRNWGGGPGGGEAEGQGEGTLFERFRKIWRPACDV